MGAVDAHGNDRVLKVALPGHPLDHEARLLSAAAGRGYARIFAHDPRVDAVLLEHLGPALERTAPEPEDALDELAATLREAWRVPLGAVDPTPPGHRARRLHALVSRLAEAQQREGTPAVRQALTYAAHLADTARPATEVVAHGDAHPGNLLRSTRAEPPTYLFVDPDGVRAEPEYDAGVAVRDWVGRLDGDDPRAVVEGYCTLLAESLDLDAERIWAWGYLERVSTGLYLCGFGAERLGRRFLDSAERLLS